MPFWWNRRRRPWYSTWRKRRYRFQKRKRPRYRRRRKPRPNTRRRRRRRRRYKVRRKRAKITIKQWQPDCIKKCKIKGFGYLVAGAEGTQFYCYTNQKSDYTHPKAPGGGGFGCEQFSLEYLFKEWQAHRNVWTKTNQYLDLCRYTGCRFDFYRHRDVDFIISYDRQPPFDLNKDTYLNIHPQYMLLQRHKKIIPSIATNPTGKPKTTLKIKPPKQMTTKWFFQEEFCEHTLVKLQGAAIDLNYSLYGPNTQSPCINITALNTQFYKIHNWLQQQTTGPYKPYNEYPTTTGLKFANAKGTETTINPQNYTQSIALTTGLFAPAVLQAIEVKSTSGQRQHERPVAIGRYNPLEDTGKGNKVWLISCVADSGWATAIDKDLVIIGEPLYIALFGLWDWILKAKGKIGYLQTSMFVVQSPAIKVLTPTTQTVWPLLDASFIQGLMPYQETRTKQDEANWVPTALKQREIINAIVECGPFVPKLTNLPSSTWQLFYKYTFYFKWGGQQVTNETVQDPQHQDRYPVPDNLYKTIEIADPLKQYCKGFLRSWDFRRGIVTKTALKRMSENIPFDSSLESDTEQTPKKKKKYTSELQYTNQETQEIQSCLLSLCEESTLPQEETDLYKLIQHQQQQQQKLKQNLVLLLTYMKRKQRQLQLQTGLS
nr:MAG: ORF1 [Torque teno midi virus]